jgi:hypothetical protein
VSETAYFRRFWGAARSGDPRAAARTLVAWLDRWQGTGTTVSAFAAEASDDALDRELLVLERRVYQPQHIPESDTWSGVSLVRAVARIRKGRSGRRSRRTPESGKLHALNPRKGTSNQPAQTLRQLSRNGWTKGQ